MGIRGVICSGAMKGKQGESYANLLDWSEEKWPTELRFAEEARIYTG
jgi:hypothetical protein